MEGNSSRRILERTKQLNILEFNEGSATPSTYCLWRPLKEVESGCLLPPKKVGLCKDYLWCSYLENIFGEGWLEPILSPLEPQPLVYSLPSTWLMTFTRQTQDHLEIGFLKVFHCKVQPLSLICTPSSSSPYTQTQKPNRACPLFSWALKLTCMCTSISESLVCALWSRNSHGIISFPSQLYIRGALRKCWRGILTSRNSPLVVRDWILA